MKNLFFLSLFFLFSCANQNQLPTEKQSKATTDVAIEQQLKVNDKAKENAPYVLLISLDGYRHDYTQMYKPKNISTFVKKGSSAKSLMPSYPTKTFPNHYSIVTGLYPDNHGIVANKFYAPDLDLDYSLKDKTAVTNKDFYQGQPIWNTASKNGLLSATLFWPGSEADINGRLPDYYRPYDHGLSMEKRVETVINWIKLPKQNRPHLMTMYYHHIDSAGHKYGPNSVEVQDAITAVDKSLGSLFKQISQLDQPINIILVSDHGMTETSGNKVIYLSDLFTTEHERALLSKFKIIGAGPIMHFYYNAKGKDKAADSKALVTLLNKQSNHHHAFLRGSLPQRLNFNKNPRMGEIVIKAQVGWSVMENKPLELNHNAIGGNHGYSQFDGQDMHGIFYAQGPNIIPEKRVDTISNVNIYPFITTLLGINIDHKIDGDSKYLAPLYKHN